MVAFDFGMMMSQENQVKQIPIDMLIPYHNHQFTLYEGERCDDMIESIRQNGVMTPIIVRPMDDKYEILIGHNRWNCSKLAGLDTVPSIIKEHLTDDEAEIYVIESNLIQRGFNDLKISEQAKVVALRYEDMFSQGKRNDIISELMALENSNLTSAPMGQKLNSREQVGEEYGLSRNTVARLLRINKLYDGIKNWVDNKCISVRAAVELSYLGYNEQMMLFNLNEAPNSGDMLFKISEAQAKIFRELHNTDGLNQEHILKILVPIEKEKSSIKNVKVSKDIYKKYFADRDKNEISEIIELALEMYFKNERYEN